MADCFLAKRTDVRLQAYGRAPGCLVSRFGSLDYTKTLFVDILCVHTWDLMFSYMIWVSFTRDLVP